MLEDRRKTRWIGPGTRLLGQASAPPSDKRRVPDVPDVQHRHAPPGERFFPDVRGVARAPPIRVVSLSLLVWARHSPHTRKQSDGSLLRRARPSLFERSHIL